MRVDSCFKIGVEIEQSFALHTSLGIKNIALLKYSNASVSTSFCCLIEKLDDEEVSTKLIRRTESPKGHSGHIRTLS